MSVIDTLTEGIRARSLANEGEALLGKWEKTGLLEGLGEIERGNMSRLLENQAAQLLRETSTMSAGDVDGFAGVAFPIVRRVFGNLIAQDLVSVQPMSLPSGLIFFLDFLFSGDSAMLGTSPNNQSRLAQGAGTSLYGGGVTGSGIIDGVNLAGASLDQSFYGLNNGFSSPTSSLAASDAINWSGKFSGVYGDSASRNNDRALRALRNDPIFVSGTSTYAGAVLQIADLVNFNAKDLPAIVISGSNGRGGLTTPGTDFQVRHLSQMSGTAGIYVVGVSTDGSLNAAALAAALTSSAIGGNRDATVYFPIVDAFQQGGGLGSIRGTTPWGLENTVSIPSIDIKVDSVAVTAVTKKLKAQWSPELAQDLNAYHNLDAEVELTSILSEQIALEIDQEILADLVAGANAGTLYWSRSPGKFVDRDTGSAYANSLYPSFTGNVSEWYETLLETVNEVSARIHRKTLRGGANFLVCSPEVANVLEFTAGFRAAAAVDDENGSWGAQKVGSISRKMDILVDPYFARNLLLVGRKGSSFLESGYVYAPYVPLQVTPTIFGPDDFVPRKGVMTRYAKKMVRPDMYGLVIVMDLVQPTE
tara:strand:- start:12645 stop:14411 length:1767 start_codon:yes stop_codon:yes gene_type:complete